MAVPVGFEPTEAMNLTCFRDMLLRPLGHGTADESNAGARC